MWVFGGTDSRRDDSEINTSAKTDVESKRRDDSVESTWTKDLEAGFSFFAPLLLLLPPHLTLSARTIESVLRLKKKKNPVWRGSPCWAHLTVHTILLQLADTSMSAFRWHHQHQPRPFSLQTGLCQSAWLPWASWRYDEHYQDQGQAQAQGQDQGERRSDESPDSLSCVEGSCYSDFQGETFL